MLEAELEDELGYSKYDIANKDTDNHRNGYGKKHVISSMGEIELDIPRDCNGEYEPQFVKKRQTDISNIEDQVLSMYAKGTGLKSCAFTARLCILHDYKGYQQPS